MAIILTQYSDQSVQRDEVSSEPGEYRLPNHCGPDIALTGEMLGEITYPHQQELHLLRIYATEGGTWIGQLVTRKDDKPGVHRVEVQPSLPELAVKIGWMRGAKLLYQALGMPTVINVNELEEMEEDDDEESEEGWYEEEMWVH